MRPEKLVDCVMVLLMPLLMAYSLAGELFHEAAGLVMLTLFLVHHWLNRRWWKVLTKGRYTPRRVFQTGVNLLLLAAMVLQPVSGVLLSKHLFPFLSGLGVSADARTVHLLLGHWSFVLMSLHCGTHFQPVLNRLKRKGGMVRSGQIAALVVSLYGCWAFVKHQFPDYLFLRSAFVFFDPSQPLVAFLLDYLTVFVLFAVLGHLAATALGKMGHK